MRPKVAHLIPRDGVGGVETAARSMAEGPELACGFRLIVIAGPSLLGIHQRVSTCRYGSENNPLAHISAVRRVLAYSPDVLICSLWRSVPVAIIAKVLRRKIRLVLFLHSASTTHVFDRLFNGMMFYFSDAIWGDSAETIADRMGMPGKKKTRVISFVTNHPTRQEGPKIVSPSFVFWGRLHRQKGLDFAIDFIRKLRLKHIPAELEIWGPDDGVEADVLRWVKEANLGGVVRFRGVLKRSDMGRVAKQHCFFLQLSRIEGMAMAVVEAMQMGLVPVVTPVGEIGQYCRNGENAVVVRDPGLMEEAINLLTLILNDQSLYQSMRDAARNRWSDAVLYREDVCSAATELLTQTNTD